MKAAQLRMLIEESAAACERVSLGAWCSEVQSGAQMAVMAGPAFVPLVCLLRDFNELAICLSMAAALLGRQSHETTYRCSWRKNEDSSRLSNMVADALVPVKWR